MDNQPEAPMMPTAWLVHAQYPFVTMDPPIDGGLPRTELFTRDQIAAELRRLHAENERLRIEAQNSKEAWDALTDHAEKVRAENERLRAKRDELAECLNQRQALPWGSAYNYSPEAMANFQQKARCEAPMVTRQTSLVSPFDIFWKSGAALKEQQ